MRNIKREHYTLHPSDHPDWIIIETPSGLRIDTEIKLFYFRHRCKPTHIQRNGSAIMCSELCCYGGCYVSKEEIQRVTLILDEIIPDLQADAINLLEETKNQIYDPKDYDVEEELFKIRCAPKEWNYFEDLDNNSSPDPMLLKMREKEFTLPPKNHCLFLMKNGLCAIHKYYIDHGEKWYGSKQKFNICTTFPLDIRPQDKTIGFMEDFEDFLFSKVACVSHDEDLKKALRMPYIIDSMKEIIIDRFNLEYWETLKVVARDWRAHRLDLKSLYQEKFNVKYI